MQKLATIILAAGRGSRIGKPKWQLIHSGKSFLEIIVDKIIESNYDKNIIICVASADSIPNEPRVKIAINPDPGKGMISSVYYGVQANPDALGYLLIPVDHPFVAIETFTKLKNVFLKYPDCIVCPTYEGRKGHPIIVPNNLAAKITTKNFLGSLRDFLISQGAKLKCVAVNDANILKNINTQQDLA